MILIDTIPTHQIGNVSYRVGRSLDLPVIPAGFFWHLAFDSCGFSAGAGQEERIPGFESVDLAPRSVKVLVAAKR